MSLKIIFIIVYILIWSIQSIGNTILLPGLQLTTTEKQDYISKENSFVKEFCKISENGTSFSKNLILFLDQPNDENFEIYIKTYSIRKNDQKILLDYLKKFSNQNLLKKYKKIFSILEDFQSDCKSSSINIFGFYLSTENFEKIKNQIIKDRQLQQLEMIVLSYNNSTAPTTRTLKSYLLINDETQVNEQEPFIFGNCESTQINDVLYDYFDRQTKFDYFFGSSCEFSKSSSMDYSSKKNSFIVENKVLWIGASVLIGGFILSRNNKELIFEY